MSIAKRFGTVTLILTRDVLAQMGCGTSSSTARSLLVANRRSDRFDVVMETVGKATRGNSIRVEARRHASHRGPHRGGRLACRIDPRLLHSAVGRGIGDGHPR